MCRANPWPSSFFCEVNDHTNANKANGKTTTTSNHGPKQLLNIIDLRRSECEHSPTAPDDYIGLFQATLPDVAHAPAFGAELAGDLAVAFNVTAYFFAPEFGVLFGFDVAAWTAVPKTAVHKNGQLLLGKNEIRFAGQGLVPSPPCEAVFLK